MRLLLRCGQCPGDVVVMTAAVRELHRQYPDQFQTDVRTCAPAIWEHNPHITPIADGDRDARTIEMHYPLINQSNQRPVHFLEGYCEHLAGQLGLPSLRPQQFRGDIYISDEERGWMNQVEETAGYRGAFWLVNAGSKTDFTCKQWPLENYQAVIDHFRGRITFVQIGASEHNHPPLSGVIDLRGKTDHRQLIRLVYHSSGVLTGVSYPMHLAAAVPVNPKCNPGAPGENPKSLRPCVVINGGREPPHWEQYPGHQFLHTIGALDCCATGGCWKSRVVPLGDRDHKDRDLCHQPIAGSPRCMRLITPEDVIRAIEMYERGGEKADGRGQKTRNGSNPSSTIEHPKLVANLMSNSTATSPTENLPSAIRVLIDFRHGLGDAVQLTTVLLHLRHYYPDWQIDVAAGVGKLPASEDGLRSPSSGEGDVLGRPSSRSLYHRFLVHGRDAIDRRAYRHVFELSWDECPTSYADVPSTKAEHCLRTVFKLQPISELCHYELSIGERPWQAAKRYLESVCGTTARDGRYPAVLLHYQANTSTEKKDLPDELARQVCETAIEAGYVPVILDWDKRSPLPDGVRIFNPGADSPLWGNSGTGDSEVLAALIAQSSLFVGVDSGPLHVAGATLHISTSQFEICNSQSAIPTPVLAVWTGHHPLHYFCPADHVTHLVPEDHAARLRGDRATGRAFFETHYRYRTYEKLAVDLPALVTSTLSGEAFDQVRNKQFLRTLRATGYTENYYLEHKLAGLDYLTFGDWQRHYGRWLVDSLGWQQKRVLDVGCACGAIARGLTEAGAAVEGIDLSEAMLRRGRETWPELADRLHCCDAVNLHLFEAAAFDAIHTSQVAEHWRPELVPFILRELARVTSPGGLLFCALDTEELFARQGRTIEQEDPTHVCIRGLSWWHEQLAAAGWQPCTADYEPQLRQHPHSFLNRYDWDWFVARRASSPLSVARG